MPKTYTLQVAGLTRELPICKVNDGLYIAAFIMFSDVEMTVRCAEELLKKAPAFDVLLTAESKGIPLAYEMSRQSGKQYILARKSVKLHMRDPIEVNVKSITTAAPQKMYLDADALGYLKGKQVLIVDDVISTGRSLESLEGLVEIAGGTVAGKAAVLAEGEASEREDILFLAPLPLFTDDK